MYTTINSTNTDDKIGNSQVNSNNNRKAGKERACLEFWESVHTQPQFEPISNCELFKTLGPQYLEICMKHPTLEKTEIKQQKFQRILELVELAYSQIPVYREIYQKAGFSPRQLRSYDDIEKIPIITKRELIAAFPHKCLNPQFNTTDLFPTRSSGSSGETLLIRVDEKAILLDTIQGLRQFALQSGLKYQPEHLLTHVYTVPWWYNNVNQQYYTAFISNVIPPLETAQHLGTLAPEILSCYPSNLEALLPYAEQFKNSLYLAVTHSEYSSEHARHMWSQRLGCPVLDEYSSEEATRIALEMPCGHYHVCEDAVHLEAVNPVTKKLEKDGVSGMAIVTNLLNEAMPFIRYAQGDYITRPAREDVCNITWSQLERIDGRMNDSFINRHNRIIPSGSLLDITYRWMFDRDLHLDRFELVQKQRDVVEANFVLGGPTVEKTVLDGISHLADLLSLCLEHPIKVQGNVVKSLEKRPGKQRPIRCDIQNEIEK